ncbi:GNAT family N-acetyltransferase [Hylemonella gracilis]|nr:GNAT family N-acetyltransferase [Hylemonella gracilis]
MSTLDAEAWNDLLARQDQPTPFMRHEYLAALHASGSATPATGWTPRFLTLHDRAGQLQAACPLYLKSHSRGEYVFDWSWADAHHRHGLAYYPKGVVAVPFTPAPGSRLLARDATARKALLESLLQVCRSLGLSSLHLLFGSDADLAAAADAQLMLRHTVQFHWRNREQQPHADFDDFLATLSQDKRKKIRQERRKVRDAGVSLRPLRGQEISPQDWDFFYRCYEHTYLEHGNPPYLKRDFFTKIAAGQAENWLLFLAEREGRPIASSLIGLGAVPEPDLNCVEAEGRTQGSGETAQMADRAVAWGRYWGALERVDCLHFEACYYAPLEWCIAHGMQRFEGGAQGEHKLARALLPVQTSSAHWLAQPDFARAVRQFLEVEGEHIDRYLDELTQHSPLRQAP